MKIKEINGQKFSRGTFKDYKLRVSVVILDKKFKHHMFDIYTTTDIVEVANKALTQMVTDNVRSFSIRNTSTREDDDRAAEFIDDVLNNI